MQPRIDPAIVPLQPCHVCDTPDNWGVCESCDRPACQDHGYCSDAAGGQFICETCERARRPDYRRYIVDVFKARTEEEADNGEAELLFTVEYVWATDEDGACLVVKDRQDEDADYEYLACPQDGEDEG